MIIFNRELIVNFCKKHARAKKSFMPLLKLLEDNNYNSYQELKETFATVDYVYHVFTIFDVAGNNYRMVTKVDYDIHVVEICYVWTHEEYDKNQAKLRRTAKHDSN